tara:strand:- start:119 stop:574 length:456 start_codon:yes stop_codon:yes gene_type:complete
MIIKSLNHLQKISEIVADNISEGDFIFLTGEIGVGKTTFVRKFINYLQKRDGLKLTEVLSPTFNLLYEYELKQIKILHYDLFRINSANEIENLGIFKNEIKSVKLIEWPQLIKKPIKNSLNIYLKYSTEENQRELTFKRNGKWKDLKISEL